MVNGIAKQTQTGIVMPAVSAEEAVNAFNAYQELAKKITRPEDTQLIQGKVFKKKSFWRKCQRFFNLSLELKEEKRTESKNGVFTYKFVYRAKAPNKAFVDGTGACSSDEKGLLKTEHNTRAIAETRAKNRATADLVAFGEVSAEEIVPSNGGKDPTEEWPSKDEHFCQMHNKPMKNRGGETWDHRAQGDLNEASDEVKYNPKGLWYRCIGKGYMVGSFQG